MTVVYRRRSFKVTCPAASGTPATPGTNTTAISLGTVTLHRWIVTIPNGHAGVTGVALLYAGVVIVPFTDPTTPWVRGNANVFDFDIEIQVGKGLTVEQTNAGAHTHAHYLQFTYTPVVLSTTPAPSTPVVALAQ